MSARWSRRAAEPGDVERIHELHRREWSGDATAKDEFIATFAPQTWVIVEGPGDSVAGVLRVERKRHEIFIHDLVVATGHESQGMATALVRELIDEAVRTDLPLAIHVPPTAARALRLLRFLGFVVVPSPVPGRSRLVWRV